MKRMGVLDKRKNNERWKEAGREGGPTKRGGCRRAGRRSIVCCSVG